MYEAGKYRELINILCSKFVRLFILNKERKQSKFYSKLKWNEKKIWMECFYNIHNKVSFNIECFKNFLPLSSISLTVPGAQLKEAGY